MRALRQDPATDRKSQLRPLPHDAQQEPGQVTSRREAKALGLKTYHGERCEDCGGTKRRVAKNQCVACRNAERCTPEAREKRQEYLTSPEARALRRPRTRKRRATDPAFKLKQYTHRRMNQALKAATRAEAKAQGLTRYFGKVCEKHPELKGERHMSNRNCAECFNEWRRTPEQRTKHLERKKRPEYRAKRQGYSCERRATDPLFKLSSYTRRQVRIALKRSLHGAKKSGRTIELLGCSIDEFMQHIEAQFTGDMSWANHGSVWSIDHIRPIASFDLRDPAQQRKAFGYRNCRPMIGADNISKGSTWKGKRWRHGDHANA